MREVKIIALTELGKKGIEIMKKEASNPIIKRSLKMLKTELTFDKCSITIQSLALAFCHNLEHNKVKSGIQQIIDAYRNMGAQENIDFKIEAIP